VYSALWSAGAVLVGAWPGSGLSAALFL